MRPYGRFCRSRSPHCYGRANSVLPVSRLRSVAKLPFSTRHYNTTLQHSASSKPKWGHLAGHSQTATSYSHPALPVELPGSPRAIRMTADCGALAVTELHVVNFRTTPPVSPQTRRSSTSRRLTASVGSGPIIEHRETAASCFSRGQGGRRRMIRRSKKHRPIDAGSRELLERPTS